jgi:hypothetical protein
MTQKISKKEYLTKLLDQFKDKRPLAKGLLEMINKDQLNEKTITSLSDIIRAQVKQTTKQLKLKSFEQQMKSKQPVACDADQQNADDMLKNL